MELREKIIELYKSSENYPALVRNLIKIGIQSYTVDVTSGIILYRLENGKNLVHEGETIIREISQKFNKELTQRALKENQEGRTTYAEFLDDIAYAGVRFYEATLNGPMKRVTYIGSGGNYEEAIPL